MAADEPWNTQVGHDIINVSVKLCALMLPAGTRDYTGTQWLVYISESGANRGWKMVSGKFTIIVVVRWLFSRVSPPERSFRFVTKTDRYVTNWWKKRTFTIYALHNCACSCLALFKWSQLFNFDSRKGFLGNYNWPNDVCTTYILFYFSFWNNYCTVSWQVIVKKTT